MPGREKKRRGKGHNPLGEDLHADRFASFKGGKNGDGADEHDEDTTALIPSRATNRILSTARRQLQEEEALDEGVAELDGGDDGEVPVDDENEIGNDEGDDDEEVELEYDDQESQASEVQDFGDMGDQYDMTEEEMRLLQKFQPQSGLQTRNLADIIMSKIKEKEQGAKAAAQAANADAAEVEDESTKIDKRVARVYSAIGTVLKHYSSGKIPKAFKVLPHIQNWEQLLLLTRPDEWSPHAAYQATRIFAASLNEKMAQRFYVSVLLPIVHHRMQEERKLHPSLYMAIRKALFKPVAFYKGFLLPLCQESECTLREALVIASVLQKMHLPPVPTAVAIVKLAHLPFSGANSVFIRVLIDKKMALPYQAIDALVQYFHKFVSTHGKDEILPVLWHQTLLSFAQRYKGDLTEAQATLLLQLCSKHFHYLITPEIRRELAVGQGKANWMQ